MNIFTVNIPEVKFTKFGKLPGKPSELINLALADLRASERAGFKVNMDDWLVAVATPTHKHCTVCFAGAVMAQSLGKTAKSQKALQHKGKATTKKEQNDLYFGYDNMDDICRITPVDFKQEKSALMALNDFREGNLEDGFRMLDIDFPDELLECNVTVTPYADDKNKFKQEMAQMAASLARVGY